MDIKTAREFYRSTALDLLVMVVAFVGTLCLGVEYGILIAIGVSLLLFIYHSTNPTILDLGRQRGTVIYRYVVQPHFPALPHTDYTKRLVRGRRTPLSRSLCSCPDNPHSSSHCAARDWHVHAPLQRLAPNALLV